MSKHQDIPQHNGSALPWRRVLPARACPQWECGAAVLERGDPAQRACANGHQVL